MSLDDKYLAFVKGLSLEENGRWYQILNDALNGTKAAEFNYCLSILDSSDIMCTACSRLLRVKHGLDPII